ncbi:hypothetical protein J5X84_33015 [Streptosporangiaceae bacterium NEAU-GS5]|nr:hypothetical protein [Streptosporangiaceae bacterium NEAU-GS5]
MRDRLTPDLDAVGNAVRQCLADFARQMAEFQLDDEARNLFGRAYDYPADGRIAAMLRGMPREQVDRIAAAATAILVAAHTSDGPEDHR